MPSVELCRVDAHQGIHVGAHLLLGADAAGLAQDLPPLLLGQGREHVHGVRVLGQGHAEAQGDAGVQEVISHRFITGVSLSGDGGKYASAVKLAH